MHDLLYITYSDAHVLRALQPPLVDRTLHLEEITISGIALLNTEIDEV